MNINTSSWTNQCRRRDRAFLAEQPQKDLDVSMAQSLDQLASSPQGFVFTPTQAPPLAGLIVKDYAELCLFGDLATTHTDIQKFLTGATNLGTEAALAAGLHLQGVLGAFLRKTHQETAMVMVRTSFPTGHEDFAPRWHLDGTYLGGKDETKLVWSMAGRGTLVAGPNPEQRTQVEQLLDLQRNSGTAEERDKITHQIDALVSEVGAQSAPDCSQATLFRVGDHEQSCLHSEPPFDQHRIFVAMVPTSAENLPRLRETFELNPLIRLGERLAQGSKPSLDSMGPQIDKACDFWGDAAVPALLNMQKSADAAWVDYASEKLAQI